MIKEEIEKEIEKMILGQVEEVTINKHSPELFGEILRKLNVEFDSDCNDEELFEEGIAYSGVIFFKL